ncbi:MAG: oligosaccharide flippase family protein [Acidobacteria bacterium]|nr:oligosaccharide flippase family protein [Acidobacteriota bacterium]
MSSSARQASSDVQSVVMAAAPSAALRSRLLSGSLVLLTASTLTGVMNLLYNLVVARMLGPVGFSHATAVYTLLTLISAITLSFQVVCAKLVANHAAHSDKAVVYWGLHRKAWRLGLIMALLIVLGRREIAAYLNLPSANLVLILALGTAFYIPLGVRRGAIQGAYAFRKFGFNLLLEGIVRLGGGWALIYAGWQVPGAVFAGVAGVIAAYFVATPGLKLTPGTRAIATSFRESLQASIFFVGQVVINNFDIVLAKHFFPPREAGLYAAIALVGRLVNMCAWSVVNAMFPMSASLEGKGRQGNSLLISSLLLVTGILTVLIFGVWMVPDFFWNTAFGVQFQISAYGSVQSLLVLYALTTGIYSLSAVMIAYEMSRKIAHTSLVQLAFGGALVLGIYLYHDSLQQMILVQLMLMSALLVIVAIPVLFNSASSLPAEAESYATIRRLRPVSEEEVIAEFLKNEFHHAEFDAYRQRIESLVSHPDLHDPEENALRRALLFIRRGAMWRELPNDTRWYEVEITPLDLSRVRVFPRAQWRKISQGSFFLNDIVKKIRAELPRQPEDEFFEKLQRLSRETNLNRSILFIGTSDSSLLTILDGNHRIASALLASPGGPLTGFRFLCGFSPRMRECCWYETNLITLWRYAKNLVRHVSYDPETDIGRLLQTEP